jgi:hypothetical protein
VVLHAQAVGNVWEELIVEQPQEGKIPWSPRIYPAVTERLAPIARKKE